MRILNIISDWIGVKAIPALSTIPVTEDTVLLDVPSYSQTDGYSCGAIAAWSIVETFNPRADFWKLYNAVSPDEDEGVGPGPVMAALRKFKIKAGTRTGMGWKAIKATIDQGFPMLVGTGKESEEMDGDHWSLLYGYGVNPNRVFLGNQPGILRNQVEVEWAEFRDEWWSPRGQAIVCRRR